MFNENKHALKSKCVSFDVVKSKNQNGRLKNHSCVQAINVKVLISIKFIMAF